MRCRDSGLRPYLHVLSTASLDRGARVRVRAARRVPVDGPARVQCTCTAPSISPLISPRAYIRARVVVIPSISTIHTRYPRAAHAAHERARVRDPKKEKRSRSRPCLARRRRGPRRPGPPRAQPHRHARPRPTDPRAPRARAAPGLAYGLTLSYMCARDSHGM